MTDDFRGLLEDQGRTFHAVQTGIERLNDRCDSIETTLGRSLRGTMEGDAAEERRQAEMFAALITGKAAFSREETAEPDFDAYRLYRGVLSKYLRYGLAHLTPEENQSLVTGRVSAKALSVGIEADGGYWVTPQISERVIQRQFDTSPMRTVANVVTIGTDAIEFPTDSNDLVSGGWVGETNARGETATPEIGVKRIPVHEQFANPRATQKLLDDAAFPVEQWLADKIADKFIREENAAFVSGEKFSEILQGLERDILRILTRTLITEPIAEGIRGGIQGDETSAGGLEGLLNKVFGTAGVFFGEEEAADTGAETSDAAEQAATSLLAMGNAGDTTGALLRDSLSEGAAKAGIETLTQASTSAVATTQLGELAIAAGTAAAALQALVATAGAGGAGGGGGGPLGLLSNIAGVGQFLTPVLGNSVTGGFGTSNPLATGFSGNPHFASGGRVGGRVSGPGGPLSDSIPAFLSDGEFVVNAEATRRHRRLLELINAGITPPAFATGGQVAPFLRFANADMTPSPAARAPRREAAPDTLMRPIVVNINGVTDPGSFQRSRAQLRGQLREMISRAEKRDD